MLLSAVVSAGNASAFELNRGKVLATGGVSMVDGAGGGGITPWATITGYATRDGINGDVHYTYANLSNYTLHSYGGAVGLWDRVELSYSESVLTTGSTFDTVGLAAEAIGYGNNGIEPFNTTIEMSTFGAKVRVFGEAIYDSDNLIPQIAIGGFYKKNKNEELLRALGAAESKDWEGYIAATKIFFPINTLINITARYTAANQTGLVGFGGPEDDKKEWRPEISIAYLLRKDTAIGIEFQKHGNNLDGQSVTLEGDNGVPVNVNDLLPLLSTAGVGPNPETLKQKESDWLDFFIAYFPNKNLSMTFAYADLGHITLTPDQHGFYLSLQASF